MNTESVRKTGPAKSTVVGVRTSILRHLDELDAQPATGAQLDRIWPPWNALREDLLPEEKRRILTLDESSGHDCDSTQFALFQELRQRFGYLPLDRHEYNQAFKRACLWATLVTFARTTSDLHKSLVDRQWAFADANSQALGRVAISRTVQEIGLTHPGLLKSKRPTLEQIQILEDCYTAYSHAREQALSALADLVFKVPGMRTGKVLPLYARARGVPEPPPDVPIHLFLGRLDALGICSPERLKDFMREVLPRMGRKSRQEFYRMSLRPHYGKEPYAALRVWLLENRPILENEQFGWQWSDVQMAAGEKQIEYPHTGLRQWASRHCHGLHLKIGPATKDDGGIQLSKRLLSPAPVFGGILNPIPM